MHLLYLGRHKGNATAQLYQNGGYNERKGKVLKKYGECDKAHEVFLEQAAKCEPPFDDSELKTIWFSALKFFRNKVSSQEGYVAPDQYNDDFNTKLLKWYISHHLENTDNQEVLLESLYEKFNLYHPESFRGHSLSASDIVALKQHDVVTCHYVDSEGFAELPKFLKTENY